MRSPYKTRSLVSIETIESPEAIVEGNAILGHDVEGTIDVAGTQVEREEEWQLKKVQKAVCNATITVVK